MHRPLFIAAFVLLLAAFPLAAQRGGGHGFAGGGHGGFAGHSSFGGHSFSGMHSSPGFPGHSFGRTSSFGRGFSRGRPFGPGRNRSGVGLRIRSFGYGNNCWGYGCGWGYGYPYLGGGIDPYWWWDSDSSSDPGPDSSPQYDSGLANQMNEQGIYPRRLPNRGDQDVYAPSSPLPQQHQEQSSDVVPPTVLVFRDQHKREVQNYAIVGQTLWAFAPQHAQKIPLSDLDLPATTKANDERGVDFKVPGSGEGQ